MKLLLNTILGVSINSMMLLVENFKPFKNINLCLNKKTFFNAFSFPFLSLFSMLSPSWYTVIQVHISKPAM